MDKKVKNILQYGLWIAVAAVLLYFSFRGVNWKDFGMALRECHWGFVLLSMLLGAAAFWLRALRWRMQLLPLDASTTRITTWNAVNVCTLTNFVLPRVGEIARCGYVVKHSGRDGEGKRLVTFDKVLGTVVADRVWDGLSLLAVTLLIFVFLWNRFGSFLTENLFPGLADKAHLWWILALCVLLAGGLVYLCWRLREQGGFWGSVWGWIRGAYDGLISCLHMRHGWLFILYTVLLWVTYRRPAADVRRGRELAHPRAGRVRRLPRRRRPHALERVWRPLRGRAHLRYAFARIPGPRGHPLRRRILHP